MGYFGKQVGRAVVTIDLPQPAPSTAETNSGRPHFVAKVGKPPAKRQEPIVERCPRCNGTLAEDDGFVRCGGRCGRHWVVGGPGRWLDPGALPFGVCNCCRPRLALVAAEIGAVCPGSHIEYLILPEGVTPRHEAAPLGVCRCCLPPQPLVQVAKGLVCRNKPQQHYGVETGRNGEEVTWLGLAPTVDQAAVTAAIDAALRANKAELTLFGLFAPPDGAS